MYIQGETNNQQKGEIIMEMKMANEKMKKMREIIDTWNIIEKYNIKGWKQEKGAIYIPTKEFDRIYEEILNKSYLINLLK